MQELLRKLCVWICVPIYNLIPKLYSIFYSLANTEFLSSDIIEQFSANIYILVSVVMLFAFSITILSAIVNPDLLTDNKKGVSALFKRSIIGLALMVLVPFAFNEMYSITKSIMDNMLIEKIIVGYNCSGSKCEKGGNGGQVIAGTLINSVLYPVDDEVQVSSDINNSYRSMVQTDIGEISTVASDINILRQDSGGNSIDGDFAFHFDGLIAIIAGAGVCYILFLFALDMAVRIFKLAFLELTAPISIVSYIGVGDKILLSWLKEVGKTFAEVFIKVASIAFYLFLLKNMSSLLNQFKSEPWISVFNCFLIVGMLIFVKQIPDIISRIFGNFKLKGGVSGRLGEMAVVGKQAQAAWNGIKQAAKLGVGAAGLGLATAANPLAVAGAGLAHHAWNKGFKSLGARPGKETATGKFLTAGGKTAGAYLRGKGLTSGLKDATKAYSESDFGLERIANKNYEKATKNNEDFNKKMGFNKYGQSTNGEKDLNTFNSNVKKDLGKSQAQAIQNLTNANLRKATVDQISSDKDAIISELDALRVNAKTTGAVNTIESIKNSFAKGKMSANEVRTKLNGLIDTGEIDSSNGIKISGKLDSIENTLDNNADLKKLLLGEKGVLKVGTDLKDLKTGAEKAASVAKSNYDTVYNGTSESVKQEMDNYAAASDEIISTYVKEKTKGNDPDANNINTVGKHYKGSKENDGDERVEIHSNPGTSNVLNDDVDDAYQQMMDAQIAINEERNKSRSNNYNNFNSEDTSRNQSEGNKTNSTENANTGSTAGSAAAGAAMGSSTGSSSVQVEGLDDLFNNLNKTITSNSDNTNKILEDQLNEQKSMNNELKNQTNSINNVDSKLSGLRNDINNNLNDIKKSFDESNTNSGE